MARTGRRPGHSGAREAILDAAREAFAEHGFEAASLRSIARRAGVDPALVHHYFGTKDGLFAAAMELPIDVEEALPALIAPGVEGLGERLVRFYLGVWEAPETRDRFLAVVRGAVTHEASAAMLRGFITRQILSRVAAAVEAPDPQLRASLVGSQLVGLSMVRYVVRVEPLASADAETVVAAVAPTIQRYLTRGLD